MFTYRRGSKYELPADFEVPTCSACGAMFFDESLREAAKAALKPMYLADQRTHLTFLMETIHEKAGVSNRDVERACGVTRTYLSHLLKGRKEASEPLIGLLEAFAIHPADVHRRLQRQGAHDTESVRVAIHAEEEILWRESIRAWSPFPEYDFDFEGANDVRAA
jgi:transcriptional regulator with XRE-family HTH domain